MKIYLNKLTTMTVNNATVEKYYVAVRPQTNEIHAVHKEGCPFMPEDNKRIYLGLFSSGNEAGQAGKKYFGNSHGCRFCSEESSRSYPEHHHVHTSVTTNNVMLSFLN